MAAKLRFRSTWPRVDSDQLLDLGAVSSALVFDACADAKVIGMPIRRLAGSGVIAGNALTISTEGQADNLVIYASLKLIRPGDVLVIASEGCRESALVGDNLAGFMRNSGALGVVSDGLVRDTEALRRTNLAIHAAGTSPRAPRKEGAGSVGYPVMLAGVVIATGDLVVADDDGVVIVPRRHLGDLMSGLSRVREADRRKKVSIMSGAKVPQELDSLLSSHDVIWDNSSNHE